MNKKKDRLGLVEIRKQPHKKILKKGRKVVLLISEVFTIGNTNKIKIANNIAKTPPILFGIDLKIKE
jgi:hypothetical protein